MESHVDASKGWCCDGRTWEEHASVDVWLKDIAPSAVRSGDIPEYWRRPRAPPAPALKCEEWATRPLKSSSNAASLESESLLDTALDFEQVPDPSLRQLDRLGSIAGARA